MPKPGQPRRGQSAAKPGRPVGSKPRGSDSASASGSALRAGRDGRPRPSAERAGGASASARDSSRAGRPRPTTERSRGASAANGRTSQTGRGGRPRPSAEPAGGQPTTSRPVVGSGPRRASSDRASGASATARDSSRAGRPRPATDRSRGASAADGRKSQAGLGDGPRRAPSDRAGEASAADGRARRDGRPRLSAERAGGASGSDRRSAAPPSRSGSAARPAGPRARSPRYDQDGRTAPDRPRGDRAARDETRSPWRPGPRVNNKWGGVARRGARSVVDGPDGGPSASELWRDAVARAEGEQAAETREAWAPDEVWVQDPEPQPPAPSPRDRVSPRAHNGSPLVESREWATGKTGIASAGGHRRKLPRPVVDELEATAGAARGAKLAHRIADATYAYERERYQEARRTLRTLAEEVPESATVRELYGLVLYRTGQWAAGAKQLEAFRRMTGSFDQNPVLADCYRALRRYDEAQQVWDDLREASPSGDLVAEGRIVAAGCCADQGDLRGAIAVLERSARKVSHPQDRHLRQWYALADLYERAGDMPRARDLFSRIAANDPDAFDVRLRLRGLR